MFKKALYLLPPMLLHAAIAWAQWQPQTVTGVNPNHSILSIAAVDENVVWAVVDTNYEGTPMNFTPKFLRTTDGGVTWKVGTVTGVKNSFLMDIAALDSNTAWATTNNFAGGGGIYKTTNGGASWTRQISTACVFIYFFDAQNGVQVNLTGIGRTNNGGSTWQTVANVPPALPNEFNLIYSSNNARAQAGDTIWVGTSKGRVYRSANRGQTWTVAQTSLGQNAQIHSLAFRNGRSGLAASAYDGTSFKNQMAETNDGGVTWTTIPAPASPMLTSITYVPGTANSHVLVSATFRPGSSYTSDGGATWTNVDNSRYYIAVAFASPSAGWAGGYTTATFGGMYKWVGPVLEVAERNDERVPIGFELSQNYPNPFNPSTIIQYELPHASQVRLAIYNLLGERVRTLVDAKESAGVKRVTWDGRNERGERVSTGVYVYRLDAGELSTAKRLLFMK